MFKQTYPADGSGHLVWGVRTNEPTQAFVRDKVAFHLLFAQPNDWVGLLHPHPHPQ